MINNKCIIFGGGGFIGANLAEELVNNGYRVVIFDRPGFDRKNLANVNDLVQIIEGDFNNEVDVEKALTGVSFIFHLISSTIPSVSMDNYLFDIETNLIPSVKLINILKNTKGIRKLIFMSSGGTVYGIPQKDPISESHAINPISSYGIIKATIERYLLLCEQIYNIDVLIFRLANPYGRYQNPKGKQGVIPVFLYKVMTDQPIDIWGDGSVIRDYIGVRDVVELLGLSILVNSKHTIYNLGSGRGHSLKEIIEVIEATTGKKALVNYHPSRSFDVPSNILDVARVKQDFNWTPKINIEKGIEELFLYFTKNH